MAINLIASIVVFITQLGINFFLTPYILKSLGDEAFGFLGLANSIVSYGYVITVAINSVSGRFVAYEYHKGNLTRSNWYFSSVLIVNFLFCIVVTVLSAVFMLNLQSFINISATLVDDVRLMFLFYFINFCVGLFNGLFTVSAFIKNKLYLISIRNAISSVILACSIVVFFCLLHPMLYYVAIAALLSSIFVFFSTYFISRKIAPEVSFDKNKFSLKMIKKLLSSGIWNSFNALNRILLTGVDLFICNIFISPASMGILSVSKAAPIILESFVATTSSIFSPKLVEFYSKKNILALINEAKFSMKVVAFIASVPSAIFIVFGEEFYRLWLPFKSAYAIREIYELSMITMFPILFISYIFPLFNIDSVTNQLKRPAYANTILGALTILTQISVLKFTNYGLYGIVVAGALLYTLRIVFFDPINAALNLKVKLTTFYGIYIKHIALFTGLLALMFVAKIFIEVGSWSEFVIYSLLFSGVGFGANLFLLFNSYERRIVIDKIKTKFNKGV